MNHDFWFNKKRNRFDTPCKDCRNQQKKIRRITNRQNGFFLKSEITHAYRTKGFSKSFVDAYKQHLLLVRELKESKEISITQIEEKLVLFCPICCEFEVVKNTMNRIHLKRFLELINVFEKRHEKCSK
jgi:hypothetical protein